MESPQPAPSLKIVFPDPEDKDFDEDTPADERKYYISKYKDVRAVRKERQHCTACDRHLGSAPKSDLRMKVHPMLQTLVCRPCHTFYNSGEFERGDDGSELYCRWCGQGGQVYCCASCPHVFCAKCIKRNFGPEKIKEIESLDDWKCFRCVPRDLWDLRAKCWTLLRYCDVMNRQALTCEDPELKDKLNKECALDQTDCCKSKKRTSNSFAKKKDQKEEEEKNKALAKIPQGIKVKKFAAMPDMKNQLEKKGTRNEDNFRVSSSVADTEIIQEGGADRNNSDAGGGDRNGNPYPGAATKRPASPLKPPLQGVRAPIPIAPYPRQIPPILPAPRSTYVPAKKMKMSSPVPAPSVLLYPRQPPPRQYSRPAASTPTIIRKPPMPQINQVFNYNQQNRNNFTPQTYNGLQNYLNSDNINLSLENLTQGLDMNALPTNPTASSSSFNTEDELVCTPDFPMEPLCEVIEDPIDDDVECITPGPVAKPKQAAPVTSLPDIDPENVVQMTENDVTVNAVTGGLKFRVDPQTLSSNKMYRLPDGRIFAINANPSMPGGYSATIVAVNEGGKINNMAATRGSTFAANVSTIITPNKGPGLQKTAAKESQRSLRSANKKHSKTVDLRKLDMKTPVEWYRYNLLDSIDSLQYSITKLNRMKKEVDTRHLRSRTLEEMKTLHRQLDRHLQTSITRFTEIKDNLNKGYKAYLKDKKKHATNVVEDEDDDDDIEILNDKDPDPIFIDENSEDSVNHSDHEVTALSSEHNDSNEQNKSDDVDPLGDLSQDQSDNEETEKNNSVDKSEESGDANENSEKMTIVTNCTTESDHDVEPDADNAGEKSISDTLETETIDETLEKESDSPVHTHKEKAKEQSNPIEENTFEGKIIDILEKGNDTENNKAEEQTDNLKRKASTEDKIAEQIGKLNTEASKECNKAEGITSNESSNVNSENLQKKESIEHIDTDHEESSNFNGDNEEIEGLLENKSIVNNEEFNDKQNGMEVDIPEDLKGDSEIQMSDEMIDNLLADDGQAGELTEELEKLTQTTLDSLVDDDLMN